MLLTRPDRKVGEDAVERLDPFAHEPAQGFVHEKDGAGA